MSQKERIVNQFHDSIELIMQSISPLSELLEQAGELIVSALLNENKVLCLGEDHSAIAAQLFASQMVASFSCERPCLPVIQLNHIANFSNSSSHSAPHDFFAKQVTALGNPGDILLLVSNENSNEAVNETIAAAHDKGIQVICISNRDSLIQLQPEDIELKLATDKLNRMIELQIIAINTLCSTVDNLLFGIEA